MNGIGKKVDILIVDDRADGLIALEAILSDERINIVKAQSGLEALSHMQRYEFAVVLLDVQMPGIDGFETAERIKKIDRCRFTPFVFVTAIDKDERYVYRGYETGAVDYVFKPFDPMILRSKVQVFVDLYIQAKKIRVQDARLLDAERIERSRQLAELEMESLRRYRGLADAIPHVVCRARADGVLDYFNRGWTDLTGISLESSVGDGWHRAFQSDDLIHVLKVWVDAMLTSSSFEAEARVRRKDGVWRWHLVRGVAEKRNGGEVAAWICTATDIDDRKKIESQLRRAKDEAESANLAKTQFLANMSHEIRTPLSAILGFSELLLSPTPVALDEQKQNLHTIRRNGEQLLHLINEILDISKVESGNLEIEEVQFSFKELLNELHSLFGLKASEKSLAFKIRCGLSVPLELITDPVRLRQILINVVGNAVKFTSQGTIQVLIEFEAKSPLSSQEGILRIRVKDSGIGIPKERVERLFKPFSQADSSTTRRFGGTGLGLALSKKLAETLGGHLRLQQSSLNGSVFEMAILCKRASSKTLPLGEFLIEAGKSTQISEPAKFAITKRVLVVDDAPDNQVLISRYLRLAGATVDLASNGYEAVAKAVQNPYDIILMDIQMPGMDGYAATQALRDRGMTTPIIALTAHALKTERDKCLNAGFDDHLSKPVERARLIDIVANCEIEYPHAKADYVQANFYNGEC